MSVEEEKNQNQEQEQEQEQEVNKDSKLSSKDDSINKKMQEMYDKHKKEAQTNQRPQSKYQRDHAQSGKADNKKDKDKEDQKIDEKEIIVKINEHFTKKQITKKEFSDNQNVFLPLDEFFELFKNIHLDLSNEEINYLFNNKNPNKDDGYIYFNTFLDNYNFEFYPGESTLINKSNTEQNKQESSNSNYTSLLLNKQDKITPAIQNEFSSFKNDILNIVEESRKPQTAKKKLPPIKKENSFRDSNAKNIERPRAKKNTFKEIKDNANIATDKKDIRRKPQSANKTINGSKHPTQKKHKVNYLKQTLQRQMLEEEMIKLTIDKRDKEFQRDCVKKMVLANEYAEKLGIPKSYSAYSEEGENTIICRVFSKTIKDYKDINLKQFLIEFKKLEKCINQQNEREKYKENKESKEITSMSNNRGKEEDFFKMDRNDKHKIIKKILKESIQLKLQLKKQLKALRDKKLIDIDTLNKNLKLTNLDDDTIL
jgi:hypothetical protein